MLSAPAGQVKLERICPKGGKSGGRRAVRNPSHRALVNPCSVARLARS